MNESRNEFRGPVGACVTGGETCGQDAHTPWGDPGTDKLCGWVDDGDLERLSEWIFAACSTWTAHGTVRSSRFTALLEEQAEA